MCIFSSLLVDFTTFFAIKWKIYLEVSAYILRDVNILLPVARA
jgi:hypothetical protein